MGTSFCTKYFQFFFSSCFTWPCPHVCTRVKLLSTDVRRFRITKVVIYIKLCEEIPIVLPIFCVKFLFFSFFWDREFLDTTVVHFTKNFLTLRSLCNSLPFWGVVNPTLQRLGKMLPETKKSQPSKTKRVVKLIPQAFEDVENVFWSRQLIKFH